MPRTSALATALTSLWLPACSNPTVAPGADEVESSGASETSSDSGEPYVPT